jgi:hypothetical protein
MHALLRGAACILRTPIVRDAPHSVISSRMVALLTLGVVGSLAACHDGTVPVPPRCEPYPIPKQPADGARSAAQTELASLSSGATMTWNVDTGTLTSILQLAIPLPGCTDGQDVGAQVLGALAAHRPLFQLDLTEWQAPAPFDCKFLGEQTTITLGRRLLAGRPVAKDVFVYSLDRIDGVAQLTTVNGTYLPPLDAATGRTMAACNSLTVAAATAAARNTPLHTTVFSRCAPMGTVSYTPRSNDVFRLSPDEWTWEEAPGQVLLTGQRTLRITVAPANYTPDLLSSDARCPVPGSEGNDFTVGFDVTFDVHTGEILGVKPGLDCIVC